MFYFFRRSVSSAQTCKWLWALLLGCAAVLVRYISGPLVTAGGLGFSRWLGGFVDIVSLPVIVPLVAALLLVKKGVFPDSLDYAGFALLWLVPLGLYFSVDGSSLYSPLMLVLVPLLWTVQALGMSFFIGFIFKYRRWYVTVLSTLSAAAQPLIASTSWWAFYSHQTLAGYVLLFVSLVPVIISMIAEN